jgi:hypothetical protein
MIMTRIGLFAILLLLFSCNEPDPFEPETGTDYFPLEIGRSWTYQMDSVIYDPTGLEPIDTFTSFMLEEVVDTFLNQSEELWFRIDRSYRASDTADWTVKDVVAAHQSNNQALRSENNLSFIVLDFPLFDGKQWNGISLFSESTIVFVAGESLEMFNSWEYEIATVGMPETIGGIDFDEVTTVYQADNDFQIEYRFSLEKYAKEVGLVYRHLEILDTQNVDPSKPWTEKAEKGFILTQTLIDFN